MGLAISAPSPWPASLASRIWRLRFARNMRIFPAPRLPCLAATSQPSWNLIVWTPSTPPLRQRPPLWLSRFTLQASRVTLPPSFCCTRRRGSRWIRTPAASPFYIWSATMQVGWGGLRVVGTTRRSQTGATCPTAPSLWPNGIPPTSTLPRPYTSQAQP